MASTDDRDTQRTRPRVLVALVLLGAIVIPGVADYALAGLGYEQLGAAIWVLGYGGGVLTIWYLWIRPMDLRGPQ